jgi:hypothetical protein
MQGWRNNLRSMIGAKAARRTRGEPTGGRAIRFG